MNPLRALEGIRVVDFCWVLAGPIGTRILANFGADVFKIESRKRPDTVRLGPGPDGQETEELAGLFNGANTGKLSVALDIKSPRGLETVKRLISKADLVTNNYRPGALERMGLGFDELRKLKPDIISISLPGTHSSGPWAPRMTFGNLVMAASGMNELMGFPGRRPRGIGIAYPDFTSPYLLVTTALAALRERNRTGRGQDIDLSQLSATISLVGTEWMQYKATGQQPPRAQNRDPNYCPHGVFPTSGEDEWIAIAVKDNAAWLALCGVMGDPSLANDPRFVTHAARKANEDGLDARLRAWTARHERFALAEALQRAGVAAGPVENLRDTYERDPQLVEHYQQVRQPIAPDADIPIDREAIRFEGHPHTLERAPLFGEHTERVLREVAELSDEEYVSLVVDGIAGP